MSKNSTENKDVTEISDADLDAVEGGTITVQICHQVVGDGPNAAGKGTTTTQSPTKKFPNQ